MKTISQIINEKQPLVSVGPDETAMRALALLAEHDIGALLVLEGGRLRGMLSERDYARKVVLRGKTSADTRVRDIMSERVIYVTPSRTVAECMALMTERHIRHLPVLGPTEEVLGIVSIGDLVKETIAEQRFIIEQLERYITQ